MKSLDHVAIIMDGNGRWAQMRGRPRIYGHIKGARVAKKIITCAADMGLKNLTLYTFSSENWLRPKEEVHFLMTLLERYLKKESHNLYKKNIRFTTIGEIEKLPESVQKHIAYTKDLTAGCTGLEVCFAISYGSKQEIISAVKKIALAVKTHELELSDINENIFDNALMTAGKPHPDVVIRTSGEYRLSNFLMWQCAYSELFFTETLWPDFTENQFLDICKAYFSRDRRFGRVEKNNYEEPITN